ncbi:MAG: hypothetical protein FRX49_01192 [Trebouxia sp. A1-2]|nr:MAG: hypothetical protein FRX49_01192 [Trebouxia sp. A1-2]
MIAMTSVMLPVAAKFHVERAFQDAVLQCSQVATFTDDQMSTLQQTLEGTSVATACQRVAGLRATVPNQLSQRLTEHLQQCRPATDCVCDVFSRDDQSAALDRADQTAAEHGTSPTAGLASSSRVTTAAGLAPLPGPHADALCMTPLSPAPAKLQNMYMTAVQRMPALRAKLEEALQRMDRVVHAIERDSTQASPYTAQLAVQLDDGDAADSVSPALQQALQSGKVVTRRQLTKDVNPVPFAA